MKSRRPLRNYDDPKYPDLEAHRLSRRTFLRSLGTGAMVVACSAAVTSVAYAGDPEMGMGGDMPAPVYATLVMPTTGTASVYLKSEQYLTFQVRFSTYAASLGDYASANQDALLLVVQETLAKANCGQLDSAEDHAKAETDLTLAIEAFCKGKGAVGDVADLVLLVNSCEDTAPMLGDVAEPMHPAQVTP